LDNVSHTLAGWALSRAAGSHRPPGTTLALVLASNLPDIDILLQARSDAAYLLFHRGITHSLVGLVLLPLLLAAGLWWGYGGRTRFDWLALVCACGVSLHLLYDVVTPWGTMLLYPFSAERYALDWLFIVDFVTWALPIAALLAAHWRPTLGRTAVVAWMLALSTYCAAAAIAHRNAIAQVVGAEQDAGRAIVEAFAFPGPGAPWRWNGVAISPSTVAEPRIAMYRVRGLPPRATLTGHVARAFDDPWVMAALATRPGQAYLWWARVPVAAVGREDDEVAVTLTDLRYTRTILPTAETWTPFAIRFRFDERTGRLIDVTW
jgi:inner membrane protein